MQKEPPIDSVLSNPFNLQKLHSWQHVLSSLNNEENSDDKETCIKINDQIYAISIKKIPQNQKTSDSFPRIFNDPLEKTPRDSYQNDIVRQISSDFSKKSSNKSGSESKDRLLNLRHNDSCNNGFECSISEFQEGFKFKDETEIESKNTNPNFIVNELPQAIGNVKFKLKYDEANDKELKIKTNNLFQSVNEKNLKNEVTRKSNKKKSNSMHLQELEKKSGIEKEPSTAKLKIKESAVSSESELKLNELKKTLRKNSNSLKFLCADPSSDSLKLMEMKSNPLNLNKSNTVSFAPISSAADTMKEQKLIEIKLMSHDTFNSAEDLAFSITDSREESPKKMLSIGEKKTSIEQNHFNSIFSKNEKNDEVIENIIEGNNENNYEMQEIRMKFENNLQFEQNLNLNEDFFKSQNKHLNRNSNGIKIHEKFDEIKESPFNLKRDDTEKIFNDSADFFENEKNVLNEDELKDINFKFKNNKSDSIKSGKSPKRYDCNLDDLDEDKSMELNSDIVESKNFFSNFLQTIFLNKL